MRTRDRIIGISVVMGIVLGAVAGSIPLGLVLGIVVGVAVSTVSRYWLAKATGDRGPDAPSGPSED